MALRITCIKKSGGYHQDPHHQTEGRPLLGLRPSQSRLRRRCGWRVGLGRHHSRSEQSVGVAESSWRVWRRMHDLGRHVDVPWARHRFHVRAEGQIVLAILPQGGSKVGEGGHWPPSSFSEHARRAAGKRAGHRALWQSTQGRCVAASRVSS